MRLMIKVVRLTNLTRKDKVNKIIPTSKAFKPEGKLRTLQSHSRPANGNSLPLNRFMILKYSFLRKSTVIQMNVLSLSK